MTTTTILRHARFQRARVAAATLAWLVLAAAAQAADPAPAPAGAADAAAQRVIAREELGIDVRVGYAGERIIESSEAGRTVSLREFRMPGKARLEFEESGQRIVMILDEPAGTAYMLLPGLNLYSEVPVQTFQARAWESLDLLDFEKLNREDVDGHAATRYRISWQDPDGNRGHGFHWVTDDGVPIRMDVTYDSPGKAGERVVAELRNLVVAPQDAALFERPANYLALPSLEGLLGTMSGSMPGSMSGSTPADSGAIDLEVLREGLGELLGQ